MSSRLSRPRRTRVYDCNYSMGERYYRPVVDDLDRRYTSRGAIADAAAAAADVSISSLRSTLGDNESSLSTSLRRAAARAVEVDEGSEILRRRPVSTLLEEYDSIFDHHSKTGNLFKSRALVSASLEDDEDVTITNNLKRLRAARAARRNIEEEVNTVTSTVARRAKPSVTEFSEKVLGTVGLKNSDIGKARLALAEDSISRRVLKMTTSEDGESSPNWSRWSKVSDVDAADEDYDAISASRARKAARARMADLEAELGDDRAADAAKERARKSRARLADLDAEMEAMTERGAAREKRAANLRSLVQENEANSEVSAKSAIRVKKVSSTEKKIVTF